MAIVNKVSKYEQKDYQDNRYCHCGRLGSVAWTTHAGPETKWLCTDHAFKRDREEYAPSKNATNHIGALAKRFSVVQVTDHEDL